VVAVVSAIATAMVRRNEHATTDDGHVSMGCDLFEAPAGGIETVCQGGGRTDICFVRTVVLSGVLGRSDSRWWYQCSAAESSSATAVHHHRRGDRLLRTKDDVGLMTLVK